MPIQQCTAQGCALCKVPLHLLISGKRFLTTTTTPITTKTKTTTITQTTTGASNRRPPPATDDYRQHDQPTTTTADAISSKQMANIKQQMPNSNKANNKTGSERTLRTLRPLEVTRTRYTKPGEQQLSVCPWAWLDHRYLDMNSILHETLIARGGGASEVERVDLFAWR